MAEIKVDKAFWERLSHKTQGNVSKQLLKHNIIKTGDVIIAEETPSAHIQNITPLNECAAQCGEEATAVFVACMSSGADEATCQMAAEGAYHACIGHCGSDDDDEGDDEN